jgi:hypothetical protein
MTSGGEGRRGGGGGEEGGVGGRGGGGEAVGRGVGVTTITSQSRFQAFTPSHFLPPDGHQSKTTFGSFLVLFWVTLGGFGDQLIRAISWG